MKNIKLNLKQFLMRGALAITLISTPATLTGCGKDKEEDEKEITYVWADNLGIVEYELDSSSKEEDDDEIKTIYYADRDGNLRFCYIDEQALDNYICHYPNGKTIYETVDESVIEKFIKKQKLLNIEENLDMLLEATKDNNPTFGKEVLVNDKTGEREETGRLFITVHYYQTYRITIDSHGKPHLEEGPVIIDFKDTNSEYPFVKEDFDQTYSYDITEFKDNLVGMDELAEDIEVNSILELKIPQ